MTRPSAMYASAQTVVSAPPMILDWMDRSPHFTERIEFDD